MKKALINTNFVEFEKRVKIDPICPKCGDSWFSIIFNEVAAIWDVYEYFDHFRIDEDCLASAHYYCNKCNGVTGVLQYKIIKD